MIVIVGLGNIGAKYSNTRHNVGFMVVDALALAWEFPEFKQKNNYFFSKKRIGKEDVLLIKPCTFMNNSGEAVSAIASFYKLALENIIVIHDDLDLATGRLKVKVGGGNGGHNGLRSIDKLVGTDYFRVRVGIEHPRNLKPVIDVVDYVLGKFRQDEMELIEKTTKIIIDELKKSIIKGWNARETVSDITSDLSLIDKEG